MKYSLIVFNANLDLIQLADFIQKTSIENCIILSSHCLFEHEQQSLISKCNSTSFEFLHFGEFNDSEAMLVIDKAAYEKTKGLLKYNSLYLNNYKLQLIKLKNKHIHEQLKSRYEIDSTTVFCTNYSILNLGISFEYWNKTGASIKQTGLKTKRYKRFGQRPQLGAFTHYLKALFGSFIPIKYHELRYKNQLWIFYSLKRIKLKDHTDLVQKRGMPFFISRTRNAKCAIGLHQSGAVLNLKPFTKLNNLHIIGDAFRPSVYPPYLFAYPFQLAEKYIPKDKIDGEFFSNNGLKLSKGRPEFLAKESFDVKESKPSELKNIILSLNHAGDWSALINRSDTDILIKAFCDLSADFEELNFIIRLHPTMNGPRAEGEQSIARIEKLVQSHNRTNLTISGLSLEEDWERGDLFISEYSLSVIDAIKRGNAGMFCNLTNRISFMQDWTDLGMIEVNSIQELKAQIQNASTQNDIYQNNVLCLKEYNKQKTY